MKKRMILAFAMIMASMLCNVSEVKAQRNNKERARVEHRDARGHERDARKGKAMRPDNKKGKNKHHVAHAPKPMGKDHSYFLPKGGRMVKCAPPKVHRGCAVPEWEGRVRRHHDGRWGYYVNGAWRYFDCYYDPYCFFAVPVPAPVHPRPMVYYNDASAGQVAAGVAVGAVIGGIIGALAH